MGAEPGRQRSGGVVRGVAGAGPGSGADRAGDRDAVGLAGARVARAGPAGGCTRRAARAHAVLKLQPNQTDAGGAGPAQGARSSGAPTARYGDRDPGPSGVLGASLCQGDGPAGQVRAALEARPEGMAIGPLLSSVATLKREIAGLDEDVMARVCAGVPGVGPVTAPGLRHHRGPGTLRRIARGGGLSGADDAALSVRGDGHLGAHLQARRRPAAEPALRGRQLLIPKVLNIDS